MADDIATRQEDYLQQVSFNGIVLDNMSKSLNLDIPDHIKDITNTAVDKTGVADISDWRFLVTAYDTHSGHWEDTYNAVFPNSANWDYAFQQAITPSTVDGDLTSVFTTVNESSANWNSVYSSYNAQSATGTGGVEGSANWNSVYSSFNSQSANNALVNIQFSSNSANWNSVYSSFNSQSANNDLVNTQFGANSANWNSVYSSFNAQSASNAVVNSTFTSASGNWQTTFSTVSSQSANWGVPAGSILTMATNTLPSGYLPADGSSLNSSVYGNLFNTLVKYSVVTMTIATPCVVTWNNHGLYASDAIKFATTGALPTGIVANTTYYVATAGFAGSSFRLSTIPGGVTINTTGTQSGVQSGISAPFGSSALSAFNVPDLRGEFIRGWDNGRAVDINRSHGSFQVDEFKTHSHTFSPGANIWTQNSTDTRNPGVGGFSGLQNPSIGATGAAETRPRNIALRHFIKY